MVGGVVVGVNVGVVVAVEGQRRWLIAEPIWLDRLGSCNALVNVGRQRGSERALGTVNHQKDCKTSAEKAK